MSGHRRFESPNGFQRLGPQGPFIGDFRRQESLEGFIDLRALSPLPAADLAAEALEILLGTLDTYPLSIVNANHLRSSETPLQPDALIRAFHEFAPSYSGKAGVVRSSLAYLYNYPPVAPPDDGPSTTAPLGLIVNHARPQFLALMNDPTALEMVAARVLTFAKHLADCLFIPILSDGGRTEFIGSEYITPTTRTPDHVGVRGRLKEFRQKLIAREGSRCAVSKVLDVAHSIKLLRSGSITRAEAVTAAALEGAHIIPHGLGEVDPSGALPPSKKYFWRLLHMFDPDLGDLVDGVNIDKAYNGVLLTQDYHSRFGKLWLWFDATDEPDTYKVGSAKFAPSRDTGVTIKFINNDPAANHPPPHPRLLAIHAALAKISEISGAGEYIERLIRDAENITCLAEDGSTPLDLVWATKGLVEALA